ncbi:MAG: PIN domain-containing protein [Gemmatimonadota bacterium]
MRAIDTNVLVRLITRDDPRQVVSADRFVEKGAWVPLLALAETTWVLAAVYERRAAEIAAAVELLLNNPQLAFQDPDVVAAALAAFRTRPSVGFSDCLLLEITRKAGHLPLGTFDRDLSRLDGAERLPA